MSIGRSWHSDIGILERLLEKPDSNFGVKPGDHYVHAVGIPSTR